MRRRRASQVALASVVEGRGLHALLPRKMRLLYVPIGSVAYHQVAPGMYVDLLGHQVAGGRSVVAQGLFVMAVIPGKGPNPTELGIVVDADTASDVVAAMHTEGLALTPVVRPVGDVLPGDYGKSFRRLKDGE